jgi:hypothetical protein
MLARSAELVAPVRVPPSCSEWSSRMVTGLKWPREESNLRAWIRSPPLYPLSYGAVRVCTVSCASAWWR